MTKHTKKYFCKAIYRHTVNQAASVQLNVANKVELYPLECNTTGHVHTANLFKNMSN